MQLSQKFCSLFKHGPDAPVLPIPTKLYGFCGRYALCLLTDLPQLFPCLRWCCIGFERGGAQAQEVDHRYDLAEPGGAQQAAAVLTDPLPGCP